MRALFVTALVTAGLAAWAAPAGACSCAVGGYMGEAHDGTPRLFVNVCGGSVRQLEAAPATTGGAVPVEGTQSGGSSTGWRWVGLGLLSAAGVVAAGAYGIWRRRAAPVSGPG
jgi:hypothetical protein